MWKLVDDRGAQHPAEQDAGRQHEAKPAVAGHWNLDPAQPPPALERRILANDPFTTGEER